MLFFSFNQLLSYIYPFELCPDEHERIDIAVCCCLLVLGQGVLSSMETDVSDSSMHDRSRNRSPNVAPAVRNLFLFCFPLSVSQLICPFYRDLFIFLMRDSRW